MKPTKLTASSIGFIFKLEREKAKSTVLHSVNISGMFSAFQNCVLYVWSV